MWFLLPIILAAPWLLSVNDGPSFSIGQSIFFSTVACIFLVRLSFIRDINQIKSATASILLSWLIAALTSAIFGLYQYTGFAVRSSYFVNTAEAGQAFANLRQRNHFATLLNLGLGVLLWSTVVPDLYYRISSRSNFKIENSIVLAAAALLAAAIAATSSRTGLLQLLLLCGLVGAWHIRGLSSKISAQTQTLVAATCAYILAALVLPLIIGLDPGSAGILARFKDAEGACQSRLVLWGNVIHLIAEKPWLGWGWGELDHAHFITMYPGPRFCDLMDNAHNLPLHLAVELGIPFALIVCSLALWLIVRQKPWRESHPTRQQAWAVLAIIALHSMLEYPLWYGAFQMSLLLAIVILWKTSPRTTSFGGFSPVFGAKTNWAVRIASSLALLCCGYAAWDYWRVSQIYTPPKYRAAAYRDDTLLKVQASWLFRDYVKFAELTTTPLTRENAEQIYTLAVEMLHFSPEPKVVRLVIESATLLGRNAEAVYYLERFKAAFPNEVL